MDVNMTKKANHNAVNFTSDTHQNNTYNTYTDTASRPTPDMPHNISIYDNI